MAIGAAFVAFRAGRAVETGGVSSHAHPKSSEPDTVTLGVATPGFQFKSADNAQGIALGPAAPPKPDIVPASSDPPALEHAEGPGSPAASPQAQAFAATARAAVSGSKKRPSVKKRQRVKNRPGVMHARRHRDDENEMARWQDRRAPSWGERGYADDRYWHGAYRNWVY